MIIEDIKQHVAQLIEQNRSLKKDNTRYKIERERFLEENKEQLQKIALLEQKIKAMELAGGLITTSGSVKLAKGKVNKILREIDNCIALINW